MTEKSTVSYDVGYGRPPKHAQWQVGQSGNESGRPKRRKSFDDELLEVLNRVNRIRVGKRDVEVTNLQRIVTALVNSALEGEVWAISLVVGHVSRIARAAGPDDQNGALTQDEREILRDHRKAHQGSDTEGDASKRAGDVSSVKREGKQ